MASALGVRFLDAEGRAVPDGGAALLDLASIDARGLHPGIARASITGACDVDNPLVGPSGASAVYGPQKGASPDDVLLLDRALGHLAAIVHRDLGIDLRREPGAGAAGGLGFGLMAFCGARLRPRGGGGDGGRRPARAGGPGRPRDHRRGLARRSVAAREDAGRRALRREGGRRAGGRRVRAGHDPTPGGSRGVVDRTVRGDGGDAGDSSLVGAARRRSSRSAPPI